MNAKPLTLKDQINFLFANVLHPDGRAYLTQEVAEQVSISHATINQLRTGRNKNPTLPTLLEICRFFDVSLSFFDCTTKEECYAVLAKIDHDPAPEGCVAEITFRASCLPLEEQRFLLKMISWMEVAVRAQQRRQQEEDRSND